MLNEHRQLYHKHANREHMLTCNGGGSADGAGLGYGYAIGGYTKKGIGSSYSIQYNDDVNVNGIGGGGGMGYGIGSLTVQQIRHYSVSPIQDRLLERIILPLEIMVESYHR
jgi:hypothetical protein